MVAARSCVGSHVRVAFFLGHAVAVRGGLGVCLRCVLVIACTLGCILALGRGGPVAVLVIACVFGRVLPLGGGRPVAVLAIACALGSCLPLGRGEPVVERRFFNTTELDYSNYRRDSFRVLEVSMPSSSSSSSPPSLSSPSSSPNIRYNLTVLSSSLFINRSSRVLLTHSIDPPPFLRVSSSPPTCLSIIRNIIAGPGVLYYFLEESCYDPVPVDERPVYLVQSIRRLHLSPFNRRQGLNHSDDGIISYWWPQSFPNGTSISSPISSLRDVNGSSAMMAITGLGLSRGGNHLVLGSATYPGKGVHKIASLSIIDGSRSSLDVAVDEFYNVALNAERTKLYMSDTVKSLRILSAPADESGLPTERTNLEEVRHFPFGNDPNISVAEFETPTGSFTDSELQGRCLYFVDNRNNRVWGFDPTTSFSSAEVTLIAGSGVNDTVDGGGFNASFNYPCELVRTADGCNLFVTEGNRGALRWIKLDSPCTTAVDVEIVARYTRTGLVGLALHDYEEELSLCVGSDDGHLFQLVLNKSQLHACRFPLPPSTPLPSTGGNRRRALQIALSMTGVAVAVATVTVIVFFCIYNQKKKRGRRSASAQKRLLVAESAILSHNPELNLRQVKRFSLATLSHCTANFSTEYRIGEKGAFGEVYWGSIDGQDVAIKVMTGNLTDEKRRQFVAEVSVLSNLNHEHLIQLIGYCQEGNRSILIYPYFHGGSLHGRLHERARAVPGKTSIPPLTLVERLSIAFQIAKGLSYLHDGARPPVVHRDVKSSNVLLEDGAVAGKIRAVLSDFGLAAIGERVFGAGHEQIVKTLHLAGTLGYMAPEYVLVGRLSEKNDVYAFGVIVLELLTGRRAVQPLPSGGGWQSLSEWVKPMPAVDPGRGTGASVSLPVAILDPSLQVELVEAEDKRTLLDSFWVLAMDCVVEEDLLRPAMSVVVERIRNSFLEAKTYL